MLSVGIILPQCYGIGMDVVAGVTFFMSSGPGGRAHFYRRHDGYFIARRHGHDGQAQRFRRHARQAMTQRSS